MVVVLLVLLLLAVLGLFWPIVAVAGIALAAGVTVLVEIVKDHPVAAVVWGSLLIAGAVSKVALEAGAARRKRRRRKARSVLESPELRRRYHGDD